MKISISIPKPCHEDWGAMTPKQQGRYCAQCDHVVADLTRATDAELVALFTSDTKPKCARFDPAQLGRALGAEDRVAHTSAFPVAAFTSLLAIAGGNEAVAQGGPLTRTVGQMAISRPAPPPPLLKGKMMIAPDSAVKCTAITGDTIVSPATNIIIDGMVKEPLAPLELGEPRMEALPNKSAGTGEVPLAEVCGTVVDDNTGEPLPFVAVALSNGSATTFTDIEGAFTLRMPATDAASLLIIELHTLGYERMTKDVFPMINDRERNLDASMAKDRDPQGISGTVEDVFTGRPLPDALVRLRGTELVAHCDARGLFALHVPNAYQGKELTLEVEASGVVLSTIPLSAHAVPCCIPVKVQAAITPPAVPQPPTCHGVGTLRMRPLPESMMHMTGEIAVTRLPVHPTLWQRVTRPAKHLQRKLGL